MSNRRFAPMGGGLETDILTGDPMPDALFERESRQQEQRLRRLDRYQALVADLAGPGGIVAQRIAAQLAERVDELITGDAKALALLGILRDLQMELQVGERIVQDELNAVLARDGLAPSLAQGGAHGHSNSPA